MKTDTRQTIYKAAAELVAEGRDPEKITSRMIAKRAGVGLGLINYHFQSREKLLHGVISDEMTAAALKLQHGGLGGEGTPRERLERMLVELSGYAMKHAKLMRVAISYEHLQGKVRTPLFIMPLLMEIFPGRSEMELRLVAFQLITALQAAFLRPEAVADYAGTDVRTEEGRMRLVGSLIRLTLGEGDS